MRGQIWEFMLAWRKIIWMGLRRVEQSGLWYAMKRFFQPGILLSRKERRALNILGLSTQIPMNYVYLTDGSKREVEISNGR